MLIEPFVCPAHGDTYLQVALVKFCGCKFTENEVVRAGVLLSVTVIAAGVTFTSNVNVAVLPVTTGVDDGLLVKVYGAFPPTTVTATVAVGLGLVDVGHEGAGFKVTLVI
jgi:hypothetical protein